MANILQNLSYEECSCISPKLTTFSSSILILGTSAIMDQTACCHVDTTSKIGLLKNLSKTITATTATANEQKAMKQTDNLG